MKYTVNSPQTKVKNNQFSRLGYNVTLQKVGSSWAYDIDGHDLSESKTGFRTRKQAIADAIATAKTDLHSYDA